MNEIKSFNQYHQKINRSYPVLNLILILNSESDIPMISGISKFLGLRPSTKAENQKNVDSEYSNRLADEMNGILGQFKKNAAYTDVLLQKKKTNSPITLSDIDTGNDNCRICNF